MIKMTELLKSPKTSKEIVTTLDDMLTAAYGNQTLVASLLNVTRGTITRMLKDNRPNHILINEDGSYTLLK